ncbi:DNA polymerase III subunit delta [Wolbachia endosymbiont of Howardula sp.]|uniref:DNA polymerase III subunit delta n=1 Tax=Wolbachia endosymbiont of Howardula sp. TaxID=2916816 RepID=UPI00217EF63D|nr:DNA polymerase III subunit delta [Wolbachia endosymbiont of Howardula sp.]UWI83302.1 DNA polymerase III subunit delta [Wolbachia endosymbiont of Howardula sp.]
MKIISSQLRKVLYQPDAIRGIMIYGSNKSLIDCYIHQITSSLKEYSIQVMDFTIINKTPSVLLSTIRNKSIFTQKKIIKLINVKGEISTELKSVLEYNIGDDYLIFVAYDLAYHAKIKSYMEDSKIFGILNVSKNQNNNICDIIAVFLKQNDIQYTNMILNHLVSYFNNHDLSIYSELEKLVLYLGDQKDLNLLDIESCFLSYYNQYSNLNHLFSAIATRDISRLLIVTNTLVQQAHLSPMILTRVISNYFLYIENMLLLMQSGMNAYDASRYMILKLHYKYAWNLRAHIKNFQLSEVKWIVAKLINLEILYKNTSLEHHILFQQAMNFLFDI